MVSMFHKDDYVVYKRDVCLIREIRINPNNHFEYYILNPIEDASLTLEIPISNSNGFLRELISKEEMEKVIARIPDIKIIESDDKLIEKEYKRLIATGEYDDLIKIIKTTFLRNKARLDKNKKVGDKDNFYFEKAEKCLYNEFGMVLNMSFDETKKYVHEIVQKIEDDRL